MAEETIVRAEHLYKDFDRKTEVLRDISFSVDKGEAVAIIGPSGTGKSTLLRCLNYLTVPTRGIVTVNGVRVDAERHTKKEVEALRKNSSMVFQQFNLFKNKTAIENVMEAMIFVQHIPKKEAKERAEALLRKVGMLDRRDFYPSKLSGGQQQRVGIARALVIEPKIIFADEPTGNLDSHTTEEVLALMQRIVRERNNTLIMVTHDPNIAAWSDRQLRVVDGKIVETVIQKESPIEKRIYEEKHDWPFVKTEALTPS